jgi:hypothetical protein
MTRRRWTIALIAAVGVTAIVMVVPAVAGAGDFLTNGTLTPSSPTNCSAGWGAGCASSGYANWEYVAVHKKGGDRMALGMQDPPSEGSVFHYFTYGSAGNGFTYTLSNAELQADGYNNPFCAYYSGTNTTVYYCSKSNS